MDTFDDFIGKAKNLVDLAGRKTSEAVEIAKLKMNRMQVNSEIQKTYEKLGAFVYKFRKSGDENNELVAICVAEIDELLAKLSDIAEKINEIKAAMRCPECGSVNDDESLYCAKCGAKMSAEEPAAPAEEPAKPSVDPTAETTTKSDDE